MKTMCNNLKQRTKNMLKKATLTLALLFMGAMTINAQSGNSPSIGVKGGLNLAKIKNADGKNKLGMVAGGFAEFKMSDKFSIRPELLYSRQGEKVGSDKIKLNYINAPILAKFYPVNRFSIEAGPQVGFLLNKKGGSLAKSDYRKLDLSAAFGVGYRLIDNLEIGARYNLGLRDITKTAGKHKNSVFQFSLGYKF